MSESSATRGPGAELLDEVRRHRGDFVDFITALCAVESPTDDPASQRGVHTILVAALEDLGFEIRMVRGRSSGDHLLARPRDRERGTPLQLLLGHTDTVWPHGTLERMPVVERDGRLFGPGTLDMKGGLAQMVFALRALRTLGLQPPVTPIVFINADEEIGSPDSKRHVQRLARSVSRAFVLEPSRGPEGLLKTARKGVGRFEIRITGKAAHAGLDPEAGASAVTELSHVIRKLDALNDPAAGTSVNVGQVSGGTRPNVVAASATAIVDVRVVTMEDGGRLEARIRSLESETPGVRVEVEGGMQAAPLERTPRNLRLWRAAQTASEDLGLPIGETLVGGGSDGNTTSLFTATLDGMGCIGEGPHAEIEHIDIAASLDRCAFVALMLLAPVDPER